jgi:sugar/nucleoside kinase (ribokinase family)
MAPTLVILDGYMMDYFLEVHDEGLFATLGMDPTVEYLGVDAQEWNDLAKRALSNGLTPTLCVGGAGGNTARVYARLGGTAHVHGQVGEDEEGLRVIEQFRADRCQPFLFRAPGATGRTLIFVRADGRRVMRSHVGIVMDFNRMDTIRSDMQAGAWFHLTGYVLDPTFLIHRVAWVAMEAALAQGARISMDIGSGAYLGVQTIQEVVRKYLTVMFLNHEEARQLGLGHPEQAAAELLHWVRDRPEVIVAVTCGADGVLVSSHRERVHVPAPRVQVRDTTGAGDSFAAGFLHALGHGQSLEACARLGCLKAAQTIQGLGGVVD